MGLNPEHEIHKRRFGRNLGVGLALGGFVVLVFALTVAKMYDGQPMEAFDHAPRNDQLSASE